MFLINSSFLKRENRCCCNHKFCRNTAWTSEKRAEACFWGIIFPSQIPFPPSLYCLDNMYFQFIKNKWTCQPGYYHALFLRMTEATGLHNFHTAKLSFCLQKAGQCRSLLTRSPGCGFPHTLHSNWTLTSSRSPCIITIFCLFSTGLTSVHNTGHFHTVKSLGCLINSESVCALAFYCIISSSIHYAAVSLWLETS